MAMSYHRSVSVEDRFVTRPAPVGSDRIVRATTPADTIRVARQTDAGLGLGGAVFVHRTL